MTETASVEKPEVAEIVITDNSKIADGNGVKARITNAINRSKALIATAPALMTSMAEVFVGVATERAICRTLILIDGEPDWAGASQTYKNLVNLGEKEAFETFSDDQKKSFDTNVRSHMRRTVLEPFVVKYAADKLGIPVAEPGDSPKLAAEVRAQYTRCKLAIPDKWRDTPPNPAGPGNDTIETPVSKVLAGAVALKEIPSVVERIGYLHKMASDLYSDVCQPNAVVTGGRKAAANATADLKNLTAAAFLILDGSVSGDELATVRAKFEKHLYQD
jgi:hypothetical protein